MLHAPQAQRRLDLAQQEARVFKTYKKALAGLIARTKRGEMYGEWNDYGRLLNY